MQGTWSSPWFSWRRLVALAFGLLMLATTAARLLTYQRYLPYMDYNDEPNTFLFARYWRGVEYDQTIIKLMNGYPPLYVWVNIVVQKIVETLPHKPWLVASDYFYALRLVSALVGIATTALVISIGWQLAGPIAGWFAGLVWGLAPIVVENNNYAIADPFVYLGSAAAIATALRAWHKRSPIWVLGSLFAALVAIYSKYTALYALVPGAIVGLMLVWQERRKLWLWAVGGFALVVGAFVYLVLIYGALSLSIHEAQNFRANGLELAFSPSRNLNNWMAAILPIGAQVFFGVLLIGVLTFVYSRRRGWRTVNALETVLILVPYSVVGIVISASATNAWAQKMRHVLPITIALAALWGVCIVQITWTIGDWLRYFHPNWRPRLASASAMLAVGLIAGLPMVSGLLDNIHQFVLPDTRYLLWQWTDVNIPTEGRILMHPAGDLERTWNRNWGGYNGLKTFEWWFDTDPSQSSPQAFYDRDITYFAISDRDRAQRYKTPAMDNFIKQLTLLKTIPASPNVAGPTLYFYRMMPPRVSTDIVFGDQITLVGYDLNSTTFKAGDTIGFRPYWHTVKLPETNYSMFIHLYPENADSLIAQHDGPPTTAERPTLTWDDPNELFIGADVAMTIPPDIKPGSYRLVIGLYDYMNGQRLTLPDGKDSFVIPITVETVNITNAH